jgi:hypothetical protein
MQTLETILSIIRFSLSIYQLTKEKNQINNTKILKVCKFFLILVAQSRMMDHRIKSIKENQITLLYNRTIDQII